MGQPRGIDTQGVIPKGSPRMRRAAICRSSKYFGQGRASLKDTLRGTEPRGESRDEQGPEAIHRRRDGFSFDFYSGPNRTKCRAKRRTPRHKSAEAFCFTWSTRPDSNWRRPAGLTASRSYSLLADCSQLPFRWQRVAIVEFVGVSEILRA